MDFIDLLKQFSSRVSKVKDNLGTEEATKMSLVVPFFQLLGYDVFNPSEFVPEFVADYGIKKGEKVDYAIFINGTPAILIEAKWCGEKLENHSAQLFRYFSTTKVKFGILTNGIIYKFFTDLDNPNLMDEVPFLELDILNIKETIVNEIKKFSRDSFDVDNIFSTASELKYSNKFRELLSKELQAPSDEFIRFFLTTTYTGLKSQNVIERFRPILKQSLNNYISEMMNDKIKAALLADNENQSEKNAQSGDDNISSTAVPVENKIVTTSEELESYFIVKNILKEIIPVSDITFKDTESYMGILYKGNIRKWICRLKFLTDKKILVIPDENKKDVVFVIDNIYDIEKHKNELMNVVKRFTTPTTVNKEE